MASPPPIPQQPLPLIPSIHINGTQTSQLLPQPQAFPEGRMPVLPPILLASPHPETLKPPPYSTLPRLHTSTPSAPQRRVRFALTTASPDCECGGVGFWGENDGSDCAHGTECDRDVEEDEDASWGVRDVGYAMLYAFVLLALVLNMDKWMGQRRVGAEDSTWSEVYGVGEAVGEGADTLGLEALPMRELGHDGLKIKFCLSSKRVLAGRTDRGDKVSVSRVWHYMRHGETGRSACETEQVTLVASYADAEHLKPDDQFVLGAKPTPNVQEIPGQMDAAVGGSVSDVQGPETQTPDDLAEEGVLRQPLSVNDDGGETGRHLGGGFGGPGWRRRSRRRV